MDSNEQSITNQNTQLSESDVVSRTAKEKRGYKFWLIFASLCLLLFLSALETTAVANALPVIAHDLQGQQFAWVGTSYALASVAFIPMTGGFAEIFGRRPSVLGALALFALGSALCGSAKTMNWLIIARAVQGMGGGAILSLSSIVVSDLVSLQERGAYNGLIGMVWAFASALGPVVGGSLAQTGQWRWIFYLNLPVCGIVFLMIFHFLLLPTPAGSMREKVVKMDWIGNGLVISSTTALVIAITWGGVRFAWSSAMVLAPLVVGLVGLVIFMWYEFRFAPYPMVPRELLSNRTSISGYIQTFCTPMASATYIYYLPVYFQACRDSSPIRSSVEMFGYLFVLGPCVIMGGVSVAVLKRYRPQLWTGWAFAVTGAGLYTMVSTDTALSVAIGLQVITGAGIGGLFSETYFPVLSPLPVSQNSRALAFFAFLRSFAVVWAIAVGSAVLQNQLGHRLPREFVQQLPGGTELAYSAIPEIRTLPQPLKNQVRDAFGESLVQLWKVITAVLACGLLSSLFMADIPMHNYVDEKWTLKEDTPRDTELVGASRRAT